MGRRVTSGVVGGSGLGTINVISSTITTTTTNGDLTLDPNGTGVVRFDADALLSAQNDLRFGDADSSNYVALQAPSSISTNYTLTLPDAVAGTNGFALTSDTNGVLSWSAAGAALSDNNTDSGTNYVAFTTQNTGFLTSARVATTTRPLTYQPSTGTLSTTLFNETSSIALKENLVPIENALEKILNLQGYLYDRRDGSRKNEPGLIAEEVELTIPEIVTKDATGKPESIAYQRLVTYLIESVKELKAQINELKG
jgi:hypothetical protein